MKILISRGCRSDYGLSDPIIKRMKQDPFFEVILLDLKPDSFGDSYFKAKSLILHYKPDALLAMADRIEVTAACAAAFHTNLPIIHYGAGVLNGKIVTWDDINRHCNTLWSELQLCESKEGVEVVNRLCVAVLKKPNAFAVGCSHVDDIELDESLVPSEPYELVLYNPNTINPHEIPSEIEQIYNTIDGHIVWIGSNPDPYSETIKIKKIPHLNYYENLPRSQFLGLLKNCKHYVTNSSSAYYEAPLFLKGNQVFLIGDRNRERSTEFKVYEKGASDRVIEKIKEWWSKRL